MPPFCAVLASIDVHTATLLSNLLHTWSVVNVDPAKLGAYEAGAAPVGLVVLQSLGDQEELLDWCATVQANASFADARLVVALDPDLALQYGPARAAGAHECLMVPASVGHIERMLKNLLGDRLPKPEEF